MSKLNSTETSGFCDCNHALPPFFAQVVLPVPFLPAFADYHVEIPQQTGSAEFVQYEPPECFELMLRKCGLADQQHAV